MEYTLSNVLTNSCDFTKQVCSATTMVALFLHHIPMCGQHCTMSSKAGALLNLNDENIFLQPQYANAISRSFFKQI